MRNFLTNLRYKTAEFMQGRNGVDALCYVSIFAYCLLAFIRIFFTRHIVAYRIIGVIMLVPIAYILFRIMSKNVGKRQLENERFMVFWRRIRPKFVLFKDRIKDIKTKRYRTCPGCKNVLRLPYSRGKHTVRCPKCGKEFKVRIL